MAKNHGNRSSKRNCWDCKFIDMSGIYFPGRCNWFKEVKNEAPKEIPGNMVDKGCGFFKPIDNYDMDGTIE